MRVLSVDPGYERLGVAVLEKNQEGRDVLLFSDCIQTPKEDALSERLYQLGTAFEKLIETHSPSATALERLFFNVNQKTALGVAEVRGMLTYIAKRKNLTVFEYSPQEIKVAITGNGASPKDQVALMTSRLVKIDKTIQYDDEYDAIAVGLTCLARERS